MAIFGFNFYEFGWTGISSTRSYNGRTAGYITCAHRIRNREGVAP